MRLKLFTAVLLASTMLTPVAAKAEPITLAIVAAISTGLSTIGASVAVQALVGQALIAISGTVISSAISLAIGFAVNALFGPEAPNVPPEQSQSNVQLAESPRWWVGGRWNIGGGLILAEINEGKLYKLIANCDSEMTSLIDIYLNDIPVTLNGSNYVTNEEFSGSVEYYKIEYRNGTTTQPAMASLVSTFPEWTTSHVGAGVADILLTLDPVAPRDIAKVRAHRGLLGLGEPDIKRAGYWGRYYDPRDKNQDVGDVSTWGENRGNAALMIAAHRIDKERFNLDADDINWQNIAEQADIADQQIVDRYGQTAPRFEIGIAIDKGGENYIQSEQRMMAACDATSFFDSDGRFGLLLGVYTEPDIILTDDDIFDLASVTATDGETDATHYFAGYTEPQFGFKSQTSAPFIRPDFNEGDEITTQKIALYASLNHNQTYRVLRQAVLRQVERQRFVLTVGLRALALKSRRFVKLDLSEVSMSGVYEKVSLTDRQDGLSMVLVLVRTDKSRFEMDPSDEGDRPNFNTTITTSSAVGNISAADMNITAAQVILSAGGFAVKFVASFIAPARVDGFVELQYRPLGATLWNDLSVNNDDNIAESAIVNDGGDFEIRWRVITISGSGSDYSSPLLVISAIADTSPPDDLLNIIITSPTAGEAKIDWLTPSGNYYSSKIERTATASYTSAIEVKIKTGLAESQESYTETGLAMGDHYYWLTPLNGSGVEGQRDGPNQVTVV